MKRNIFFRSAVLFCAVLVTSGFAADAKFVRKSSVRKEGGKYVIQFEVDKPTDVTVSVLDKDGKVVRHLAAGLLGKNAPTPLANSLSQSLNWDGKDDVGKPMPDGCSVHVGLGLTAGFDRFLAMSDPGVGSRGPLAVACDGDGNVYIIEGSLWVSRVTTAISLRAFDREGNYLRTVIPFRADWPEEKISAVDFHSLPDGRRVPLTGAHSHRSYSGFLRGIPGMTRSTAQITKDGRLIVACGRGFTDAEGRKGRRLICVKTDGSAPKELFNGPPLPAAAGDTFLALSPDERHIYVSGIHQMKGKGRSHAVYRVTWKDREPAAPFLGSESESGKDNLHFDQPRGVAVDPDGRLYVCDYMNDRIQVYTAAGKFVRTLDVKGPEQVLVDPGSRALYVLSVRDRGATNRYAEVVWEVYIDKSVIKYKSPDDFTEVARIDLPAKRRYFHDCPPILCLDPSGKEPVIWIASVAHQGPTDYLWRVVDRGEKLERIEHKVKRLSGRTLSPHVAADRAHNEFYLIGGGMPKPVRVNASTGGEEVIPIGGMDKMQIGDAEVGPDGMIYLKFPNVENILAKNPDKRFVIKRYGRDGKPVPFTEGGGIACIGRHSGTKSSPFAVAPDGRVYTTEWSELKEGAKGTRCIVNIYGADGKLEKRGYISDMTKTGGDIIVDSRGRVYVADAVKPRDPKAVRSREFPSFLGSDPRLHYKLWYGTLCRFGEKGGAFRHLSKDEQDKETHLGYHNMSVTIEGAEWQYFGVGPMTQGAACECVMARMDVDGWSRIFVPDVPTYSIRVLDGNGNFLTRFGEYGNYDAQGPKSEVPKPEIPMWFPQSVAVLDGHAAVVDSHNRRVLQVKLGYRTEHTMPVP